MRRAILVVSAALWAVACGGSERVASSGAPGESIAASLTGEFATMSGDTVDLATFAGSDVVLWFWAPW